jgi:SP family xylose:H+ symportor-like MFS transporter
LKNKPQEALDVLIKVNGEEEGNKILAEIEGSVVESSGKLLSYGWGIIII